MLGLGQELGGWHEPSVCCRTEESAAAAAATAASLFSNKGNWVLNGNENGLRAEKCKEQGRRCI